MIQEIASGLGMLYGLTSSAKRKREQRAENDYEREQQIKGAKDLAENQKRLDLEMFKETSPVGMIDDYKQAGISPSLLYGMGGAGGATTGGSGGMPSRGQVADSNAGEANDISRMIGLSQIALMQAQAKKTEAEADNLPKQGENITADTNLKGKQAANIEEQTKQVATQIENTKASTELLKVQKELADFDVSINSGEGTLNNRIAIIHQTALEAQARAEKAMVDARVSKSTEQDAMRLIRQTATNKALEATAIQQGINLDKTRINEISANIQQKWKELNIQEDKTGYEHDDRVKAITEYTKNALKVAGIMAVGNLAGDIVKIATKQAPKGYKKTTIDKDGEVIQEFMHPNK